MTGIVVIPFFFEATDSSKSVVVLLSFHVVTVIGLSDLVVDVFFVETINDDCKVLIAVVAVSTGVVFIASFVSSNT